MNDGFCLSAPVVDCSPHHCHRRCAADVVDELLKLRGSVSIEDIDLLLEFRWHLWRRIDAEAALRLFGELRRRLEPGHYLAFYRIRRWLENHVVATIVGPSEANAGTFVNAGTFPLMLNHGSMDSLRRAHLCASLARGIPLAGARLEFVFRQLHDSPAHGPREELLEATTA